LFGNGEFEIGLLSGAFQEHGLCSYIRNFIWILWSVMYVIPIPSLNSFYNPNEYSPPFSSNVCSAEVILLLH
jgi:hypothetical protein